MAAFARKCRNIIVDFTVSDERQEENRAHHLSDVRVRALDQASAAVLLRFQGREVAVVAPVRQVPVPDTVDRVHGVLDIRRPDADRSVGQPDAQPTRAYNAGFRRRSAADRSRWRRRGRRGRRRRHVLDRVVLGPLFHVQR